MKRKIFFILINLKLFYCNELKWDVRANKGNNNKKEKEKFLFKLMIQNNFIFF